MSFSIIMVRKSIQIRKSKRAAIFTTLFNCLFCPVCRSGVRRVRRHLPSFTYPSQVWHFQGWLLFAFCIPFMLGGRFSPKTVWRWTATVGDKGTCGVCQWTAVAARLETAFIEMFFFGGNYKIYHSFGRVWVIEGSMSDSRWRRNQETAELDATSISFPKLVSKLSQCTVSVVS